MIEYIQNYKTIKDIFRLIFDKLKKILFSNFNQISFWTTQLYLPCQEV